MLCFSFFSFILPNFIVISSAADDDDSLAQRHAIDYNHFLWEYESFSFFSFFCKLIVLTLKFTLTSLSLLHTGFFVCYWFQLHTTCLLYPKNVNWLAGKHNDSKTDHRRNFAFNILKFFCAFVFVPQQDSVCPEKKRRQIFFTSLANLSRMKTWEVTFRNQKWLDKVHPDCLT